MAAIEVRDVTFGYGDRPVLEELTLSVEAGEFLGVVGPNGSGKTTLLTLMIGLQEPDRGSVQLFGAPATSFSDGERIGYVPQNVASTGGDMPITVREVVRMGRYPHRLWQRFRPADHQAVNDALERVEITDIADRRVGRLSGGQRQRVFIARALAADADILALDEPTVGVDAESRETFYSLLEALNEEGMTIVLIEHDIGVVTNHATTVACLNQQLYFHGDPETFLETDAMAKAYGTEQHLLQHNHE